MLGQSDLSLIPVGIIDEAEILFGGASLQTGSGGIGGMIALNTKPDWEKKTSATISSSIGSFGNYGGIFKLRTGGTAFQSVTRVYADYAENNYSYTNKVRLAEPVKETMQNSEAYQKGLLQELYFKNNANLFSGKIWIHSSDRNLPANMLVNSALHDENQIDKSLRTILSYEGKKNFAEYYVLGAYSRMELNYTNNFASINSYNQSDAFTLKAGITNRIGSLIKTGFSVEEEYVTVNSVNYDDGKARRNNVSITGQAGFNDGGRLSASILLKETIIGTKMHVPDFSTGLKYKLNGLDNHLLKANFSKVSKFPSMNDLFWVPGGNLHLQNEMANMVEFSYIINHEFKKHFSSGFEVTYYNNSIKNLIQWIPGQYSYWTAENLKKANCSGVETTGSVKYSYENIFVDFKVNYSYNRSITKESELNNDQSIGKQLIYVPKNQAGALLKFGFKSFSFSWTSDFVGERYTTSDNSLSLPYYVLNSSSLNYVLWGKLSANFKVSNIFNASYESIAYYAQPGRAYTFKLIINL
jgi:iron complex outermembrane receptor protein